MNVTGSRSVSGATAPSPGEAVALDYYRLTYRITDLRYAVLVKSLLQKVFTF